MSNGVFKDGENVAGTTDFVELWISVESSIFGSSVGIGAESVGGWASSLVVVDFCPTSVPRKQKFKRIIKYQRIGFIL